MTIIWLELPLRLDQCDPAGFQSAAIRSARQQAETLFLTNQFEVSAQSMAIYMFIPATRRD
jgi:hypothetical protein